jgi:cytoskeleton protein RodZ
MSEDDARAVESAAAAPPEPAAFGARLTAARERAGITVGEVAGHLRLHPNQVRALEEENFAALPEAAYVRGFLRSYARLVGIDAAPLVEDFNAKLTPPTASVVDGMARTSDYSPVKAAAQEQVSRILVLTLAVVALIALGAVGWYATRSPSSAPAKAASTPLPLAVPPTKSASTPPAAEPPAAVVEVPAPSAAAPAETAPPAAEPAPGPAPLLTLTFNGVSWVEVTDANGKVLLSQLARAGEVHQPAGTPPLTIVIGDASKVTVAVRGELMNLDSIARSNVARFTVK